MNWINAEQELPPYDGYYEGKIGEWSISTYIYDGIGFYKEVFNFRNVYVYPTYWRHIEKKEKKYGKVVKMTPTEGVI